MAQTESYSRLKGSGDLGDNKDEHMLTSPRSDLDDDAPKSRQKASLRSDCTAIKTLITGSVINILLLSVPLGLAAEHLKLNSALVFFSNFVAIIPLAQVLGAATDGMAEHLGQVAGGLLQASFGNAVEIIITVDAIRLGLCKVVQACLIGSVISNLLLVLGMSFLASGILRSEQEFNKDGAGANMSALMVAAIGISVPSLFEADVGLPEDQVLQVSRKCGVILALVYCFFLFFQLKTHSQFFEDDFEDSRPLDFQQELSQASGLVKRISMTFVDTKAEKEEDDKPVQSPWSIGLVLLITLVLLIQLCGTMVSSIDKLSSEFAVPKIFIGLILLPAGGNAAEQISAVTSAFRGKMDAAIGVAVGSSCQVSLLVVPFAVIVGWFFDQPMDLNFGAFFAGTFLLVVFLVASVIDDGASNWLEGFMLCAVYVMIAVISLFMEYEEAEML